MSPTARSFRATAIALVAGIGLALTATALPAAAAAPFGAVVHSNFVTNQVGGSLSVDIDLGLVDPLVGGTVEFRLVNFIGCASQSITTHSVPVDAAGHVHVDLPLASTARTAVELSTTDGTSLVYRESHWEVDDNRTIDLSGAVLPDADPATGQLQLQTGNVLWVQNYQVLIDGVPVGGLGTVAGCNMAYVPYAGLAPGSTLTVLATDWADVVIASFTNPAAVVAVPPAVVPPAEPAAQAAPVALGAAPAELASTGIDARASGAIAALLAVAGASLVFFGRRRLTVG